MVNTDALAVVLVEANKAIDKMELAVYVYGKEDLKFLAKYQAKLASARTTLSEDKYFLALFVKYFNVRMAKK